MSRDMKKLIFIFLIFLAGCEKIKTDEYTVTVTVTNSATYELEFPNLPKSETNPIVMSRYSADYASTITITIIAEPPLTARAKHLAGSACINLYVNDCSISDCGKVKEVWLTCE
jgi:hypothetical protein